jgi:transcriptional regulator with XRE-family HTH domain
MKHIMPGEKILVKHESLRSKILAANGERIRDVRSGLNLTQAQLADKCALHRTFIGSVERGERNVSILNLRLIAKMLRVPLAELFAGESKKG